MPKFGIFSNFMLKFGWNRSEFRSFFPISFNILILWVLIKMHTNQKRFVVLIFGYTILLVES